MVKTPVIGGGSAGGIQIPRRQSVGGLGGYRTPGEVGAAYSAGLISWTYAMQYLMTHFAYSNNDATEYLDEIGQNKPPVDDDPPQDAEEDQGGDSNGSDDTSKDFSIVGFLVALWLVQKVI